MVAQQVSSPDGDDRQVRTTMKAALRPARTARLAEGVVVVRFHHPGEAGPAAIHRHSGRDRHRHHAVGHADGLLRKVDPAGREPLEAQSSDRVFLPDASLDHSRQSQGQMPDLLHAVVEAQKGQRSEAAAGGHRQPSATHAYRVVLAGVQTWPVDYQPLTKEITAVGYVEFNERGQRPCRPACGRIDKLFVNETGQMVKAGDELASLYSPDWCDGPKPARRQAERQ